MAHTYWDLHATIKKSIIAKIEEELKILLETKHLYQVHLISLEEIINSYLLDKSESYYATLRQEFLLLLQNDWFINTASVSYSNTSTNLAINLPRTIKIYCEKCGRIEPYNPYNSITNPIVNNYKHNDESYQIFISDYQCQACKTLPVTFLIKRQQGKLFISGRSPMEKVDVPQVIPKGHKKYYSDAIIAHNSGQTLPGLFLLRTFIEQYVASIIPAEDEAKADQLLAKYMENLPSDFKGRFPSLTKLYSDLSFAIHRANPSKELFESTILDINEHFDARKVFKLDNPTSLPSV